MLPRIALKNKTVYKVLLMCEDLLLTPTKHKDVEIGRTYYGNIHSYSNYYKAKERALIFSLAVIVRCTIPRWTLYFVGKDIESRKLKYEEIIYVSDKKELYSKNSVKR